MKTIVVMPGGFHPFHAGHYALYKSAVEAFPGADVYVAATNDQKARPFPFAIKEKLAKIAGVAPGHFVQVSSPFKAAEITSHYNPDQDVLIFVRSEKDRNEQPKPGGMKKDGTASYFQPYTGKGMQPFSKHAYFAYLPTVEFGPGITSATEIRTAWPTLNPTRKTAMVMSLYPATKQNPQLAANVVKMMDMGMSGGLNEGFTWTDYNGIGMNERLMIAETYFTTNRNLFESNDPKNNDYFLSLISMSSPLVINKRYIVSVLALISDKVMQLQYPDVVTLLGKSDNKYSVLLSNGATTEFPNKHLSEKMSAATFFFDNVNAYEKFRSVLSLKYDFSLASPDEINGNENQSIDEDTSSSSLPDVLYHGGENLISKFRIPPYGVFFSPHKDWAENYGDALTTAKVNATKVYVADSDNWNDPNSFDAKVLDSLFDRDYKTLAVCVKVLMRRGYQALQTQTDSEMVVAFPGTEIQVIPPDEGVELKFNSNSLNESQIYSYFKKKYSLYESEKFPQRMVSSIKKINETDNHNEIKQFIHRVETFDYPGRIKVGDSLAVLDFEINFAWKEIEGRGFTQTKRITKISADSAGINYIEFEDGDRYPRLAKATFGDKQRPMEFAAYFKKSNDAEHAITVLGLIVPDTWEYNTSEIQRGNTSEVDEQFTTNLTTEGNLTEVFDSDSYPLEWEEVNDDEISAYFTTDNGRAGEVLFTIWDYPNHKDVVYLEFAIKGKQNVTGGGDALKIFSTSINATKEFISKNPTNYILFDAEEENRKRLYVRMAKSLETGFELITPEQFVENYSEGQSVLESFGDVFIILQRRGLNQIDEQFTTNLTTEDYLNEFYDTTGKYSGGGEGDDARRQRNARKLIAYSEKQGLRPGTVKVGYSSETGVYQITGLAQRHDTEYDWRFKIDPTSRKFVAVDATQTDADYAPDTFAPVVFDDELKEFTTNLTTEGDLNELHSDTLHSYAGKACDSNTKSIRQADWKRTTPDEREKIHQKVLRRCDGIGRALDKDHAKQENELLKNIPPHLRKKLRLPEPYVDEGSDIQLSKPIKPFNQVKQYPLTALL